MATSHSKENRDILSGTLALFMIKKQGVNHCPFLKHWQEITKDNLELQWPFWGFYNLDDVLYLWRAFEGRESDTKQKEWGTFFD